MAESREDVWGEAALRAPGGPSYEFFRDLLPPDRNRTARGELVGGAPYRVS